MTLPKPTVKSNWTVGNVDFVNVTIEPSVAKKEAGWAPTERPPAQLMNWLFWIVDQWIKYFESVTDAQFINYDIIIGNTGTNPAATHDTLQDAIDDGAIGSNQSVLITENQTINTTIDMSKSFWRIFCQPGVEFTKGATTAGVSMNAEGIEWQNGRFIGFTTGGDKAITMTALASYCKIIGSRFVVSTDTEVDDTLPTAGKKPVIAQTITEV